MPKCRCTMQKCQGRCHVEKSRIATMQQCNIWQQNLIAQIELSPFSPCILMYSLRNWTTIGRTNSPLARLTFTDWTIAFSPRTWATFGVQILHIYHLRWCSVFKNINVNSRFDLSNWIAPSSRAPEFNIMSRPNFFTALACDFDTNAQQLSQHGVIA